MFIWEVVPGRVDSFNDTGLLAQIVSYVLLLIGVPKGYASFTLRPLRAPGMPSERKQHCVHHSNTAISGRDPKRMGRMEVPKPLET
jgi:hypothetical protein